jgi:hypothetical protein
VALVVLPSTLRRGLPSAHDARSMCLQVLERMMHSGSSVHTMTTFNVLVEFLVLHGNVRLACS